MCRWKVHTGLHAETETHSVDSSERREEKTPLRRNALTPARSQMLVSNNPETANYKRRHVQRLENIILKPFGSTPENSKRDA